MYRSFTLILLLISTLPCVAQEEAIIVNSIEDPGVPGDDFVTLREAMLFATGKQTASGGELNYVPTDYGSGTADTILFDTNIFSPDNPQSIFVTQESLPPLDTGNDMIDGSNAGVIIEGNETGFVITSNNNTLRGMQVINFPCRGIDVEGANNIIGGDRSIGSGLLGQGMVISGNQGCGAALFIHGDASTNNKVYGCNIGVDATGNFLLPNIQNGLWIIWGASSNIVGSATPSFRNIISGNRIFGIQLFGKETNDNVIVGNYIGVNGDGNVALPNDADGIHLGYGVRRTIIKSNLLSGNKGRGIVISSGGGDQVEEWTTAASENVVIGNLIGTDVSGQNQLGNESGISIDDESWGNIIGGTEQGKENLILWNQQSGITLGNVSLNQIIGNIIGNSPGGIDVLGPDNTIARNFIGVMPDKKTKIPIKGVGIGVNSTANKTIIGPSNVIMHNTLGIHIDQSMGNRITQNSISRNSPRNGIELNEGGNHNIQPPNITSVNITQVSGLSSAPDNSIIEIFNDPGNQGETYLGSTSVNNGRFTFTGEIPSTGNITTTVTDPDNNTSAFSVPRRNPYTQPTPRPTATPRPTSTPTPHPSIQSILEVASLTAKPSETITIPISITQAPEVSAFQFDIDFDSSILTYLSISKVDTLLNDFLLVDGNLIEAGSLRIAAAAFNAQPFSGDGILLNIQFSVHSDATDGETTIYLTNLEDDLKASQTMAGTITISTFVLGDANDDGIVTAGDAQLAFEFAIGRKTPTDKQIKAADIDKNGRITAGDAQQIFYISIGKQAKVSAAKRRPVFTMQASVFTIFVDSIDGTPGEEILIPIVIEQNSSISAFNFDLLYDSNAVEFISTQKENSLSSDFLLVEGNIIETGRMRVGGAAFTASPITEGGVLVFLSFKIKEDFSGTSEITLENLRDDLAGAVIQGGSISTIPKTSVRKFYIYEWK